MFHKKKHQLSEYGVQKADVFYTLTIKNYDLMCQPSGRACWNSCNGFNFVKR